MLSAGSSPHYNRTNLISLLWSFLVPYSMMQAGARGGSTPYQYAIAKQTLLMWQSYVNILLSGRHGIHYELLLTLMEVLQHMQVFPLFLKFCKVQWTLVLASWGTEPHYFPKWRNFYKYLVSDGKFNIFTLAVSIRLLSVLGSLHPSFNYFNFIRCFMDHFWSK